MRPLNAVDFGEPYTRIELSYWQDTISRFRRRDRVVKITGVWGWPAVPDPIKELTILICRHMRDLEESGLTVTVEAADFQVRFAPGATSLLRDVKKAYSRVRMVM